jgi:hypothetical protein
MSKGKLGKTRLSMDGRENVMSIARGQREDLIEF